MLSAGAAAILTEGGARLRFDGPWNQWSIAGCVLAQANEGRMKQVILGVVAGFATRVVVVSVGNRLLRTR